MQQKGKWNTINRIVSIPEYITTVEVGTPEPKKLRKIRLGNTVLELSYNPTYLIHVEVQFTQTQ